MTSFQLYKNLKLNNHIFCKYYMNLSNVNLYVPALLRQNDIEQALLLEEKMSLQLRLLAASGLEPPSPPSYRHLVSESADTGQMWKEVLTAVQVKFYYFLLLYIGRKC